MMTNTDIKSISLKNITITKRQDRNLNDYYLIVNQDDTTEAFFCFEKAVKEGWDDLVKYYQTIKEVELRYEISERGNNKVTELYVTANDDDIVI